MTFPGVSPGSGQGDPVKDLVAKYQGESEAAKRQLLAADGVTVDSRGLQQLLAAANHYILKRVMLIQGVTVSILG